MLLKSESDLGVRTKLLQKQIKIVLYYVFGSHKTN